MVEEVIRYGLYFISPYSILWKYRKKELLLLASYIGISNAVSVLIGWYLNYILGISLFVVSVIFSKKIHTKLFLTKKPLASFFRGGDFQTTKKSFEVSKIKRYLKHLKLLNASQLRELAEAIDSRAAALKCRPIILETAFSKILVAGTASFVGSFFLMIKDFDEGIHVFYCFLMIMVNLFGVFVVLTPIKQVYSAALNSKYFYLKRLSQIIMELALETESPRLPNLLS